MQGRRAKMAATLRIQSDWSRALRRDEGEAWLSCRSPGKPTLYGSLTRRGLSTEGVPDIAASEGFAVGEVSKKSILISCPHENVSTKFLAPYTSFSRIHQKSITCLDISSGGGLGVSTSTDGTMKIWQAANGEIRRLLEGHVYDVNCCRFFPSGLVVLSGGMDAQLKIWSAEDASCVVTFKGHKGGILDTAIVDRGRNVLSCSRDGTARLWDCGKSACLGVIADCGSPVNGIAVGTADNSVNLGTPEKTPSEREIGTEGKILLLAREDKKLQGVGLQSRQPVFIFIGSDAFNCCTFLSSTYFLAGTQDGNIYQLDVRNTNAPIQIIHRSGAPVLSLLPYRDGFIASQGDGTCFIVQQDLDYVIDLTEADCDPVYKQNVLRRTAESVDLGTAGNTGFFCYRALALKHHPLKCKEPWAQERFRQLAEAYDVLSDPVKKGIYDRFGEEGLKGGIPLESGDENAWTVGYVFHNNPDKVFKEFFGGDNPFAEFFAEDGSEVIMPFGGLRGRGMMKQDPPIVRDLYLSLEDLFYGCTKKIKISRRVMNEDGQTSTIRDKILTIDVQPGWKQGTRITFEKEGDQGPNIIPADITFIVQEKPHLRFKRANDNLTYIATIPLGKALVGCTVDVRTLDGRLLNIPINEIVDPKYCKVVPGEGMPLLKDPKRKGDLLIYFNICFPKQLTPDKKMLLKSALLS